MASDAGSPMVFLQGTLRAFAIVCHRDLGKHFMDFFSVLGSHFLRFMALSFQSHFTRLARPLS